MLALLATMTVAVTPVADATPRVWVKDGFSATACKSNGRYEVVDPALLYRNDGTARASKLAQSPKANAEKTVLRTVDGCVAPLVVGYEVGR